jgi:hypothetical protein
VKVLLRLDGWRGRLSWRTFSARCEGKTLELPAGPAYRIEKEIKNVITAVAKTCHYWQDHTGLAHQRMVGDLFSAITAESPLIQPALIGHDFKDTMDPQPGRSIAERIEEKAGMKPWVIPCNAWVGMVCPSVKSAIWMMRGLVVSNRPATSWFGQYARFTVSHGHAASCSAYQKVLLNPNRI